MSQFATQTGPTANDTVVSLAPAYGDMLPDDIQHYLDTGTYYSLQSMPLVPKRDTGVPPYSHDVTTTFDGRLESVHTDAGRLSDEWLNFTNFLSDTQLSCSLEPAWSMGNNLNDCFVHIPPSSPFVMPDQNRYHPYYRAASTDHHPLVPYGSCAQNTAVHQLPYPTEQFQTIDTLGTTPSGHFTYPEPSEWPKSGCAPIKQPFPIVWQPGLLSSKFEVENEPHLPLLKRSRSDSKQTDWVPDRVSRRKVGPESSTARTKPVSLPVPMMAEPLSMSNVKLDTQQEALTDVSAQKRVTQRSVCFFLTPRNEPLQAGMTVTDDNGNDIKLSMVEYAENGQLLRVKIPLSNLYFCTNPVCDKMAEIPDKFSKMQPNIKGFGHNHNCRTASVKSGAGKSYEMVHGVCVSCYHPHLARSMTKNDHCSQPNRRAIVEIAGSMQPQAHFPKWITVSSSQDTGILACSVGTCNETRRDVLYRWGHPAKLSTSLPASLIVWSVSKRTSIAVAR